jgi:hypothetical protein
MRARPLSELEMEVMEMENGNGIRTRLPLPQGSRQKAEGSKCLVPLISNL